MYPRRVKQRAHGVGGLNADVVLFSVPEHDSLTDEQSDFVEVDEDIFKFHEVHFRYCLSEVGCGIIRGVETTRHCRASGVKCEDSRRRGHRISKRSGLQFFSFHIVWNLRARFLSLSL